MQVSKRTKNSTLSGKRSLSRTHPPTPSTKTGKKKSAKLRTHDPAEEGGETTKRRIVSKQRMNEQAREPGTGVERRDTFVSYSPRNVLILTPERARDAK